MRSKMMIAFLLMCSAINEPSSMEENKLRNTQAAQEIVNKLQNSTDVVDPLSLMNQAVEQLVPSKKGQNSEILKILVDVLLYGEHNKEDLKWLGEDLFYEYQSARNFEGDSNIKLVLFILNKFFSKMRYINESGKIEFGNFDPVRAFFMRLNEIESNKKSDKSLIKKLRTYGWLVFLKNFLGEIYGVNGGVTSKISESSYIGGLTNYLNEFKKINKLIPNSLVTIAYDKNNNKNVKDWMIDLGVISAERSIIQNLLQEKDLPKFSVNKSTTSSIQPPPKTLQNYIMDLKPLPDPFVGRHVPTKIDGGDYMIGQALMKSTGPLDFLKNINDLLKTNHSFAMRIAEVTAEVMSTGKLSEAIGGVNGHAILKGLQDINYAADSPVRTFLVELIAEHMSGAFAKNFVTRAVKSAERAGGLAKQKALRPILLYAYTAFYAKKMARSNDYMDLINFLSTLDGLVAVFEELGISRKHYSNYLNPLLRPNADSLKIPADFKTYYAKGIKEIIERLISANLDVKKILEPQVVIEKKEEIIESNEQKKPNAKESIRNLFGAASSKVDVSGKTQEKTLKKEFESLYSPSIEDVISLVTSRWDEIKLDDLLPFVSKFLLTGKMTLDEEELVEPNWNLSDSKPVLEDIKVNNTEESKSIKVLPKNNSLAIDLICSIQNDERIKWTDFIVELKNYNTTTNTQGNLNYVVTYSTAAFLAKTKKIKTAQEILNALYQTNIATGLNKIMGQGWGTLLPKTWFEGKENELKLNAFDRFIVKEEQQLKNQVGKLDKEQTNLNLKLKQPSSSSTQTGGFKLQFTPEGIGISRSEAEKLFPIPPAPQTFGPPPPPPMNPVMITLSGTGKTGVDNAIFIYLKSRFDHIKEPSVLVEAFANIKSSKDLDTWIASIKDENLKRIFIDAHGTALKVVQGVVVDVNSRRDVFIGHLVRGLAEGYMEPLQQTPKKVYTSEQPIIFSKQKETQSSGGGEIGEKLKKRRDVISMREEKHNEDEKSLSKYGDIFK